jgi:hypothetical protein
MQIVCKGCAKPIPADDVNLDSGLAKCRGCHAVFEFAAQVKDRSAPPRPPVPLPGNISMAEGPTSLTLVRRWKFTALTGFMLVFAGFWNLIVSIFVVATLFGDGATWKGTDQKVSPWFMGVFLTPFILIGIGTAYTALALLLNRTRVSIEGMRLTVKHGPIRWFGNHVLDAAEISQLYCTQYVSHKSNNREVHRMCVNALMSDGARIELVKGLEDAGQAFYLEQEIERHLAIESRPVEGEFKGSHLS